MAISSTTRQPEPAALEISTEALTTLPRLPATADQPSAPSALGVLLIPSDQPLPPARRLVVLVPDVDVDEAGLATRIWSLASPRGLGVLFLGAVHDPQTESLARRRLATLAAITRDDWAHVEARLDPDGDWVRAVRRIWQPGDLIVCHAEQVLSGWNLNRKSLAKTIGPALNTPVYVLSGFYPERPTGQPSRLARLLAGLPPLTILVIFFVLQVRMARGTTGWVQTALLSLSVIVEFSLLGAWEHFLIVRHHA